jgi:RNA polymerase sigma factor (sigma-70 family)
MSKSDSFVLENLKKADESALIKVYENYREEFISWLVKRYKCDINEAVEIYQNSILALCENARNKAKVISAGTIKTYLFSLGKHKYTEYKRYKTKYNNEELFLIEKYEDFNNEEELLEYEETLKKLQECLIILGEPCKSLLEMFYYKQMNCEEIGTSLNYKNEDTVKNQKYKCITRLKKIFEQHTSGIQAYN